MVFPVPVAALTSLEFALKKYTNAQNIQKNKINMQVIKEA